MRSSDGLFAFSSIAACLFALLPCLGAFDSPSLPQQSNHGKGEAALSEPPSQGNSPAELAVLVLVPAICPLGRFQLALRALE